MAQKLTNHSLQDLHSKLKQYVPDSLTVYGLLYSLIGGLWSGFDVWVDKWPDFTAVICSPDPDKLQNQNTYDNYVYTVFAKDQTGITTLLNHPGVVDWKRNIVFRGVSNQWWDIIRKAANDNGGHVDEPLDEVLTYVLEDENDLPKKCLPKDVLVGIVSEDMTDTVMTNWEYSNDDCREYIRQIILTYPSICLRNSEGNLIGYALVYPYWSAGFLFVVPEFRGRGYGSMIYILLAKQLISKNTIPWANVDARNLAAQHTASKAGFKKLPNGRVSWISYKVGQLEKRSCCGKTNPTLACKPKQQSCCGQNKMCI